MNHIRRYIFPVATIILLLFFASFPYNKYCYKTGSCEAITMRTFFSKSEGMGFNIEFATQNFHEMIDFEILSKDTIATHTNKTIIINYKVTNNYQRIVYFRPQLKVWPPQFDKYIEKYQCLCMEEQNIRAGESKTLKMVFAISDEIENDPLFIKKYFDQSLMDEQSSNGNFFPLNIKMEYIIKNTY